MSVSVRPLLIRRSTDMSVLDRRSQCDVRSPAKRINIRNASSFAAASLTVATCRRIFASARRSRNCRTRDDIALPDRRAHLKPSVPRQRHEARTFPPSCGSQPSPMRWRGLPPIRSKVPQNILLSCVAVRYSTSNTFVQTAKKPCADPCQRLADSQRLGGRTPARIQALAQPRAVLSPTFGRAENSNI